jgi:PLP dependent protein
MQTALVLEKIKTASLKAGRSLDEITLIAVTKHHPLEEILPIYEEGIINFGESRVQEALPKMEDAPKFIHWHLIGHLQKNKVKKVIGKFHLIHSVDSLELAESLSRASGEGGITTNILLQVNVSGEAAKQGLSREEWEKVKREVCSLPHLKIEGLMTMAPLTEDVDLIRRVFRDLRKMRDVWGLKHLSMGMSHDFEIAIEEGATLLRIGSAIFEA